MLSFLVAVSSAFIAGASAETSSAIPAGPASSSYSYEELAAMTFLQRVRAYNWKTEMIISSFIIAFVGLYYLGSVYNRKRFERWLKLALPVLEEEFWQVGVSKVNLETSPLSSLYVSDDAESFVTYATGRNKIDSLIARCKLPSRQNIVSLALEHVMAFFMSSIAPPMEILDIEITPNPETAQFDNFVFAVVNKLDMSEVRDSKYFLSLTKTSDSDKLPQGFVFMSDAAELATKLWSKELADAVANAGSLLRFIAVTDQPNEKPTTVAETEPFRRIVLNMRLPSSAAEDKAAVDLLRAAINLTEACISKGHFRAEVLRKSKQVRAAEVQKIVKLEEEEKLEELTKKKAEERKALKARTAALSPAEQKKLEKKEKEKELRKARKRQVTRA